MPDADRRHDAEQGREPPADRLLLAAVERAVRHRPDGAPVALFSILEHLALARRSAAARHVGRRLRALEHDGSLRAGRRHGVLVWQLSARGRARLDRDARANEELPESPQHRAWRQARLAAEQELDRFAGDLAALLAQAGARLTLGAPAAGSDAWLVLAEQLRHASRRLGSAVHCLYEWPEPDEEAAQVDLRDEPAHSCGLEPRALERLPALRGGRRNIGLWQEGPLR